MDFFLCGDGLLCGESFRHIPFPPVPFPKFLQTSSTVRLRHDSFRIHFLTPLSKFILQECLGCSLFNLSSAQFYLNGRVVVSCSIPYACREGVAIFPFDHDADPSEILPPISDAFWQFSTSSSFSFIRIFIRSSSATFSYEFEKSDLLFPLVRIDPRLLHNLLGLHPLFAVELHGLCFNVPDLPVREHLSCFRALPLRKLP